MPPLTAAVVGGVLGLLIGAVIAAALMRRPLPAPVTPPPLSGELREFVDTMFSAAVLLGVHDEVLAHNEQASSLGLVRGTRVAIPNVLDAARAARAERVGDQIDATPPRTGGQPSPELVVRVQPLIDGRVLVLAEDQAAARRVHEASRMFMSNATHELKTPIGAISLLAEAIADAADEPEAVARFSSKIRGEATRLTELVGQIITLSRLQGEGRPGGPVALDSIITQTVDRCRQLAERRQVTLTIGGQSDLETFGQADQLVTALSNLVQNAIAYSDKGARVAVTTRRVIADGDAWVDISVTDNGIGIAAGEQQRIFERFYRVDQARDRQSGGSGLGLPIVAEIAQAHGGGVTVWSKVGSGSTFTLRLPDGPPALLGET